MDRQRLISECERRLADGENIEAAIKFLRDDGCSKIQSISVLAESHGIGLAKAKEAVHLSSTWHDFRSSDEHFHDELEDALTSTNAQPAKGQVSDILRLLNSSKVSPDRWRRRNHVMYEFLCYVNNLIGCELSENQDGSQIFIERARSFMLGHTKSPETINETRDETREKYFDLVRAYIQDIEVKRAHKGRSG